MSRRGIVAALVLLFWIAGISALAHRELFQGQSERLARAGRLLDPGAEFYAVMRHGQHVGFASSTADTVPGEIVLSDLVVTELPVGRTMRRREVRTTVRLTREMALAGFTRRIGSDTDAFVITGTVHGDSALAIETRVGSEAPRPLQTVPLPGPVLLPAEVPYAIALGSTPKMGQSYRFTVFDPVHLKLGEATVRIVAESLFVVTDSAAFDSTAGHWIPAHDTTVHAWRIEEPGGGMLDAWIDHSGRVVDAERPGEFSVHRMAYELAFENWRTASKRKRSTAIHDTRTNTLVLAPSHRHAAPDPHVSTPSRP
jgi:hypothetical protein